MFQEGDRVRLSNLGRDRAGQMPEAWGVHRAATFGEVGEVLEVIQEEEEPLRLSVEFPSGSIHNWPGACFEPAG
jgi:hypothetical protein